MSTLPDSPQKPEKNFDCVDMKQRIQDELARTQAGLSRETLNSDAARRIAADPHLRRFLAASQAISPPGRKAG